MTEQCGVAGQKSAVLGAVLVAGLLAGCHSHVALQVPAPDAPMSTRVKTYQDMQPLSVHHTYFTRVTNGMSSTTRMTDYLQLADGRRVYFAEDILPVVPEYSPAANAARIAQSDRLTGNVLLGTGAAGVATGLALIFVPLVNHISSESRGSLPLTPMLVGGGVFAGSAIVMLISQIFADNAHDESSTAFETYDAALLRQLHLCAQGTAVGACD